MRRPTAQRGCDGVPRVYFKTTDRTVEFAEGDVTVSWDPRQRGLDEDSAAGRRLGAKWLGGTDTD